MATMNLDNLLKQFNLTQKDLSDCTGINKNTISKYCNNNFDNINKTHIDLLCKFFNCTPNQIFDVDYSVEVKKPEIYYYDTVSNSIKKGQIDIDYFQSIGKEFVEKTFMANQIANLPKLKIESKPTNEESKQTIKDEKQEAMQEIKNMITLTKQVYDSLSGVASMIDVVNAIAKKYDLDSPDDNKTTK